MCKENACRCGQLLRALRSGRAAWVIRDREHVNPRFQEESQGRFAYYACDSVKWTPYNVTFLNEIHRRPIVSLAAQGSHCQLRFGTFWRPFVRTSQMAKIHVLTMSSEPHDMSAGVTTWCDL